jgi:hypothetical protein
MYIIHRDQTRRRLTTFRAGLEPLEGRALLSVSVSQFTDLAGNPGLRIIESRRSDTVTITDNSTARTTTVLADGKMQSFGRQFTVFDLELEGKQDPSSSTTLAPTRAGKPASK